MKLLAWLTETFIATFGITHPPTRPIPSAAIDIAGLVGVIHALRLGQ